MRKLSRALLSIGVILISACSLDGLVSVDDPEGEREIDRESLNTLAGGISLYHNAVGNLARGVSALSHDVGFLTDEMAALRIGEIGSTGRTNFYDARIKTELSSSVQGLTSDSYSYWHSTRTSASQARQIISRFESDLKNFYLSASYAIEAQAVLALAENFCSGVPLSTVPFEGDVEYTSGFSTEAMFEQAVALFDSSLSLAHDSIPVLTLARIGKARALLGLNRYQDAVAAVADVEQGDAFTLSYTQANPPSGGGTTGGRTFWTNQGTVNIYRSSIIENMEGLNGLLWMASGNLPQDPRVPINTTTTPRKQNKFTSGTLTFPLATWIDVLMIRAEASLENAGPSDTEWLDIINQARATRGIVDTTDPGGPEARVNLLFRERAFWFYLQGTRLSDYRRLVRQYNRNVSTIYPTGPYNKTSGSILNYGDALVFMPSISEFNYNPKFTSCININP